MKRLFFLVFILAMAAEANAQIQRNPDSAYGQVVVVDSATTASTSVSVVGMGIIAFQFTCNPLATITTAGVTLQTSEDNSTWTTTIASVDCSNPNQSTLTSGSGNFVRINATTFSGTGSVRVAWRGLAISGDSTTAVDALPDILTELVTANANLDQIETAVEDTTPVRTYAEATPTGGTTSCVIVSTATTNSNACGTAATAFYGLELYNTTTTVYYLRLYNLTTAPTCSSATGFIRSIPIPPASAAGGVGGVAFSRSVPSTASFTTGLGYCITAGSTSTDNTAAAAGIFGTIEYDQ